MWNDEDNNPYSSFDRHDSVKSGLPQPEANGKLIYAGVLTYLNALGVLMLPISIRTSFNSFFGHLVPTS